MAVVFVDGFDWGTSSNDVAYKWSFDTTPGRIYIEHDPTKQRRPSPSGYPIGCLAKTGMVLDKYIYKTFNEDHYDTLIVGFAFNSWSFAIVDPAAPRVSFKNYDKTTILTIQPIDSTGRVRVCANTGDGVNYYSDVNTTETSTWQHLEVKVVFDDTTGGSIIARVNETEVINVSGIKTYKTGGDSEGNFSFSRITVGSNIYESFYMDDLFVLDGEGSTSNDFIGDSRIDTIYPNSAGTYTNFTPTGSANNWENVDPVVEDTYDTQPDIDTYNEGEDPSRECYNLEDIYSLGTDIFGVQTNSLVRKTDAGKKQIEQFVIENSNIDDSGRVIDMYDFAKIEYNPMTVCPSTSSAWVEADVNGLQSGIKIVV